MKSKIKSQVHIGSESFDVELAMNGNIKSITDKTGFKIEAKKPLTKGHSKGLKLFMEMIKRKEISDLLPEQYQQKVKDFQPINVKWLKLPEFYYDKRRWENILWGFYNREGRFPVFQGIRREEILNNYINDVITIVPVKELKELLSKTEWKDDEKEKDQLVIKLMRWICHNRKQEFKEIQNTYFKSRSLKEEQYDKNGQIKIKTEAIEKAGQVLNNFLNTAQEKVFTESQRMKRRRNCMPEEHSKTSERVFTLLKPS